MRCRPSRPRISAAAARGQGAQHGAPAGREWGRWTPQDRARQRNQGRGAAGDAGAAVTPAAGPRPPRPSAGTAGAPAPPGCRLGVPPRPVPARECSVPTGPDSAAGVGSPPRQPPPSSSRAEAVEELAGPAGGAWAMGLEPGSAAGRRWLPPGWCRPLRAPRGGYRNPSGPERRRFLGRTGSASPCPPPAGCCRGFSCAAPEAAGCPEPHRRAGQGWAGLPPGHGWLPLPRRVFLRRGAGVPASLRRCPREIQR